MATPKRTGRGKNAVNKLHKRITDKVMEMAKAGVATNLIWDYVQVHFEATAPTHRREFDALYGPVINAAKADTAYEVGKKVVEQATSKDAHFPSQALFLETRGGWSKKSELDMQVGVDEDTSGAIATLMGMLGKAKDTEETDKD